MKIRTLLRALVLTALAALVVVPAASAHVTINPREWEAGGFARFALRVPNETPDAATTEDRRAVPGERRLRQLPAGARLDAHGQDGEARRRPSPTRTATRSPSGSTP